MRGVKRTLTSIVSRLRCLFLGHVVLKVTIRDMYRNHAQAFLTCECCSYEKLVQTRPLTWDEVEKMRKSRAEMTISQ